MAYNCIIDETGTETALVCALKTEKKQKKKNKTKQGKKKSMLLKKKKKRCLFNEKMVKNQQNMNTLGKQTNKKYKAHF